MKAMENPGPLGNAPAETSPTREVGTSTAQPLAWSPEEVDRLWRYYSTRDDQESFYFTASNGKAIVSLFEFARSLRRLEVLDYGCGPGFLVGHLLGAGARVSATDLSE